jgi:spore coat polysaccharide biosynthesis protein SpsF
MYKTDQEAFWAEQFGNDYISRNNDKHLVASNIHMFAKILKNTKNCKSIIEFGSNIGLNLMAIKNLIPDIELSAIEINKNACDKLKKIVNQNNIKNDSILNVKLNKKYDIVLTKGVLIHINPENLQNVYEKMYNASSKYIIICEYFNPTPVTIMYRQHKNKLFKRDFAGELMDKYSDLKLIDYGFCYSRDAVFPMDNITWFLLKKY